MSVSDSSDSEKSSGLEDWTLVHPFDENEEKEDEPTVLMSQPDSSIRDETLPSDKNVQLETKIQEVDDNEPKKSDASDFECIAEDGTEENLRKSQFNIDRNAGFDIESISSGSYSVVADDESSDLSSTFCNSYKEDELPANLEVHRQRTYIHIPNKRLNANLSIVLIFAFALVGGLGIGHFLGLSNRWSQQYRLHEIHVKQLTALQEEMFNCLQSRDNENEVKVCYEKVDNWKKIFEDILLENRELHDFIIQNGINVDGENDDEKRDDSNSVGEYRKLKFHLINQQLENMESLKQMEIFKRQEKEANDKLKKLEDENEELKYLINDEEDKEEILILQLENENHELRQELANLKITLQMEEEEDNQTYKEIGTLHQKINNLLVENSDLQHVIANLRYSQPLDQEEEKVEEVTKEMVEENVIENASEIIEENTIKNRAESANENEVECANVNVKENTNEIANENTKENAEENTNENEEKRENDNAKENADEKVGKNTNDWWFENTGWPDLQMEGFINHLLKIATDKNIAQNEFNQFQENLQLIYEDLRTKAEEGLITGKDILRQVHQELESKIQAVINTNLSHAALSAETIELIGKTLTDSVSKLYKIGSEGLFSEENRKKGASEINKFHKKIEGVLIKMEKQWEIIWGKVWSLPAQKDKNGKGDSKTNAEFSAESPIINDVEDVSYKGSSTTNDEIPKIKTKKETSDKKLKKTSKFVEKGNDKVKKEKKHNSKIEGKKINSKNEEKIIYSKNEEKKINSKNEDKKNSFKNKETKNNFKREDKNKTRSQSRKRVENNNSWLLERGSYRQKARIEALDQSQWYFQRPKYKQSSDKNKEKDRKSSKKKNNKPCDSEDNNSDSEDEKYCKKAAKDLRKKRSDWQKNSNRQRNLEFRIPEPAYYSF